MRMNDRPLLTRRGLERHHPGDTKEEEVKVLNIHRKETELHAPFIASAPCYLLSHILDSSLTTSGSASVFNPTVVTMPE